jgi:hypothetical protein
MVRGRMVRGRELAEVTKAVHWATLRQPAPVLTTAFAQIRALDRRVPHHRAKGAARATMPMHAGFLHSVASAPLTATSAPPTTPIRTIASACRLAPERTSPTATRRSLSERSSDDRLRGGAIMAAAVRLATPHGRTRKPAANDRQRDPYERSPRKRLRGVRGG